MGQRGQTVSIAVALIATTTGATAKLLLLSSPSSAQSGGRRSGRRWGDKQAQEHRGRGRVLCPSAPASALGEQRRRMHRRRAGAVAAWSDPGNVYKNTKNCVVEVYDIWYMVYGIYRYMVYSRIHARFGFRTIVRLPACLTD